MDSDYSLLQHMPLGTFVVDKDFIIRFWSLTMEQYTGFRAEDAVGRKLPEVLPRFSGPSFPVRLQGLFHGGPPVVFSPQLHPELIPHGDKGRSNPYLVKAASYSPGPPQEGALALFTVEDVSSLHQTIHELKQSQRELKLRLSERELLIKEVHHRVKNNLNLLIGLITFQKEDSKDSPTVVSLLETLENKVYSIAKAHDLLYRKGDLTSLDPADYLEPLAREILGAGTFRKAAVGLKMDFCHRPLDPDRAVNLGLILVEVMTNALKYGVRPDKGDTITLVLQDKGSTGMFSIANTGHLLPEDFSLDFGHGLGMKLLDLFASQLEAKLSIERLPQTQFTFEFPWG